MEKNEEFMDEPRAGLENMHHSISFSRQQEMKNQHDA
jgi:hypothetical protein